MPIVRTGSLAYHGSAGNLPIRPRRPSLAELQLSIGFIGAGRMATALAQGCVQSELVASSQVLAFDPSEEACRSFAERVPGVRLTSNGEVLTSANMVFLAVKPQVMNNVLQEIAPHVEARHLLVSIAAGITIDMLSSSLPQGTRLVRVMPNTPCLIGLGASCFSLGPNATREDGLVVKQILESVGIAFEVEEKDLDAVTGLSGSGPAFVYTLIEALTSGGVEQGLEPELAQKLAVQTIRGAAGMVLETGQTPSDLRNQVTSPGGTTLAGLEKLKELAGADAFRAAVEAATKRSVELGKN